MQVWSFLMRNSHLNQTNPMLEQAAHERLVETPTIIGKTHFYFNLILHCTLRDLISAMSFIQNLCVWDRCEQWPIKLKKSWYDNLTVSLCHALLQIMTPAEVLSAQFFAKMGSSKLTNGRAFHQGGVSILPFTLICYWKTKYWVWTDFS